MNTDIIFNTDVPYAADINHPELATDLQELADQFATDLDDVLAKEPSWERTKEIMDLDKSAIRDLIRIIIKADKIIMTAEDAAMIYKLECKGH